LPHGTVVVVVRFVVVVDVVVVVGVVVVGLVVVADVVVVVVVVVAVVVHICDPYTASSAIDAVNVPVPLNMRQLHLGDSISRVTVAQVSAAETC